MADFSLESKDFEKVQEAILKFGEDAEETINQTLLNEVNQIFNPAIVGFIPVSVRDKKHAKYNDPIIGEQKTTLELYMHSKKPYNYLFFPQNAHGCKFVGKLPNDFMMKGIEVQFDNAINILLDKLILNFK